MPATSPDLADLFTLGALLASVALAGGVPVTFALRRQRRLGSALRAGDVAALARHRSRSGEPSPVLRTGLERATLEELHALGEAALASGHPFAGELFELVLETVEHRQAREREHELRVGRWREQWAAAPEVSPEVSDAAQE